MSASLITFASENPAGSSTFTLTTHPVAEHICICTWHPEWGCHNLTPVLLSAPEILCNRAAVSRDAAGRTKVTIGDAEVLTVQQMTKQEVAAEPHCRMEHAGFRACVSSAVLTFDALEILSHERYTAKS